MQYFNPRYFFTADMLYIFTASKKTLRLDNFWSISGSYVFYN